MTAHNFASGDVGRVWGDWRVCTCGWHWCGEGRLQARAAFERHTDYQAAKAPRDRVGDWLAVGMVDRPRHRGGLVKRSDIDLVTR
jgi:hypothetical protein